MSRSNSRVQGSIEGIPESVVTCALCPGECILSCPVYRATRLRSAAPNSLARIILRVLRGESVDGEERALWLCVGCGACSKSCPLGNSLVDAVRLARRRVSGLPDTARAEPVERILVEGPELLTVASPYKPAEWVLNNIAEQGLGLRWLDTSGCGREAINGAVPSSVLLEPSVYSEDFLCSPVVKSGFTFLLENSIAPPRKPPLYALHIPERPELREQIYEEAVEMLGEPSRVVRTCSGAFLELAGCENMGEWFLEVARREAGGLPVVTPCARNMDYLRRHGVVSYTPLTLPL